VVRLPVVCPHVRGVAGEPPQGLQCHWGEGEKVLDF